MTDLRAVYGFNSMQQTQLQCTIVHSTQLITILFRCNIVQTSHAMAQDLFGCGHGSKAEF